MTSVNEKKKFTKQEKEFLLELINKYKDVIENRELKMMEEKCIVWENIAREYNDRFHSTRRSDSQLRKFWANMKTRAKKSYLDHVYRSNEGEPAKALRDEYATIMQILPSKFPDNVVFAHFKAADANMSSKEYVVMQEGCDSSPKRDQVIVETKETNAMKTVVPDRNKDLVIIKTEDENTDTEMDDFFETPSDTSLNSHSGNNTTEQPSSIDEEPTIQMHNHIPNKKNCNCEQDNETRTKRIQLLEDKIHFQAEKHNRKLELLNNQIKQAEEEHQLKMYYLKLKLEKLSKKKLL